MKLGQVINLCKVAYTQQSLLLSAVETQEDLVALECTQTFTAHWQVRSCEDGAPQVAGPVLPPYWSLVWSGANLVGVMVGIHEWVSTRKLWENHSFIFSSTPTQDKHENGEQILCPPSICTWKCEGSLPRKTGRLDEELGVGCQPETTEKSEAKL